MWQEPHRCFLLTPLHPCLFQHIVPPPSKPFDQQVWFLALCTHEQQAPPFLPLSASLLLVFLPSCSAVMWNSTKTEFEHWQRFGSVFLSSSCLSTSSPLPVIFSSFHRNPEASSSSRHISLLPVVTWHRWPDPPSARMVSTTVSNSFYYYSFFYLSFEFCESLEAFTSLWWLTNLMVPPNKMC